MRIGERKLINRRRGSRQSPIAEISVPKVLLVLVAGIDGRHRRLAPLSKSSCVVKVHSSIRLDLRIAMMAREGETPVMFGLICSQCMCRARQSRAEAYAACPSRGIILQCGRRETCISCHRHRKRNRHRNDKAWRNNAGEHMPMRGRGAL